MKLLLKLGSAVLLGLLPTAGYVAGTQTSANRIQATCENVNAETVINGVHYVCLTIYQWNGLVDRLKERGA